MPLNFRVDGSDMVLNRRPQKQYGLLGTGRRGGEGGMEVGGEGDYTPIAIALSPPD